MRDISRSHVWHDSFICLTWQFIYVRDKTHAYVWHDSFMGVTWFIHMRDTRLERAYCSVSCRKYVCDSFICVTWLVHTYHMNQKYVWMSPYISYIWMSLNACKSPVDYVWHDSFTRVTWIIHIENMTRSYLWLIYTRDMTRSYDMWRIHGVAIHCNTLQHTATHCNTLHMTCDAFIRAI